MAKLGQHFLVNARAAQKIADAFLPVSGPIIEIGPGKGVLTDLLIQHRRGNPIFAVELDKSLAEPLKLRHMDTPSFLVINKDILKLDLDDLFIGDLQEVHIAGNIPYYISKEIMDWVIRYHHLIETGIFLVQREFAVKLLEGSTGNYANAQAVVLNHLYNVVRCFDIQPGSFSPPPKVKSSVFTIRRKSQPLYPGLDIASFYTFVKRCFQNRRKTVINNLNAASEGVDWPNLFDRLGIDARVRGEQLSLEQFFHIFFSFEH